mmetsp:Transcript_149212/g.479205  ORF Transcript_149212/g.479205 Transcript_149212/m.479205 type:complete len:111 (+) Transcript_149212:112-444(+)
MAGIAGGVGFRGGGGGRGVVLHGGPGGAGGGLGYAGQVAFGGCGNGVFPHHAVPAVAMPRGLLTRIGDIVSTMEDEVQRDETDIFELTRPLAQAPGHVLLGAAAAPSGAR